MNKILQLVPMAEYGTSGLTKWIQDNVITLVILVLAVSVLWASKNGNIAKGITILAGMLLGVVALGMATGNTAQDVGTFFINLFKG